MEFVKRSIFDKCHDYITSYLRETTSTDSAEDSDCSSDEDELGGRAVGPIFKLSGPYRKVSTKDSSVPSFSSESFSHSDKWGGFSHEDGNKHSKTTGSSNETSWSSGWADNQPSTPWQSNGKNPDDESGLASRTSKAAAAKVAQKVKPKIEDPLIDLGSKSEPKKMDDWSWEDGAWESLRK